MDTAVVILNWNGEQWLRTFLPGVVERSRAHARVIVADNGSDDGSIAWLRSTMPEVELIELGSNLGFAGGYNAALRQVDAEYLILLNSDVEVTEGWIPGLKEFLLRDDRMAACQPKVLSHGRRGYFEHAGAAGGFIDRNGYPFCRGRIFEITEKDHGQYDDDREVFWATGACLLIRAEAFRQVDGFDASLFAHMEEIDFCWRAKNQGFKVMYCPDSTIFHIGGGTLPKHNSRKTYLNIRNNITMLYKNLEEERLLKILAARILLDYVAAVKFLFDGGFKDMAAVIKAHFYFWRHLPLLRKKREKIPHLKVSQIYWGNIVIDHYLGRKKSFLQLDPGKFTTNP